MIRVMLNPDHNLCFVNATLQGLAWLTLLCDGLHADHWTMGFEVMQAITLWTAVPLLISRLQPFLAFLTGDWGLESLGRQHDQMDFLCHILMLARPRFINGNWTTLIAWRQNMDDTDLVYECGHTAQPIRMQFANLHALSSDVQSLVNHWHDRSGFHRGLAQVSVGLCVSIDRALDLSSPPYSSKCTQLLNISDGWVQFPVHPISGDTQWHWYQIVAASFHLGMETQHGHYRTAIRCNSNWYIYDDNRLPEIVSNLPDDLLSQITLLWLARSDRSNDATAPRPAAKPAAAPKARDGPYRRDRGRGRRR